jgi:hypothetical protein
VFATDCTRRELAIFLIDEKDPENFLEDNVF